MRMLDNIESLFLALVSFIDAILGRAVAMQPRHTAHPYDNFI